MERVIVSVERPQEAPIGDFEVPAAMTAGRLAELIVQALNWATGDSAAPVTYEVEAYPPGRRLRADESLESAGVWDGARLVLRAATAQPTTSQQPSSRPSEGPVTGFEPLDVALPTQPATPSPAGEPAGAASADSEGALVWKQID